MENKPYNLISLNRSLIYSIVFTDAIILKIYLYCIITAKYGDGDKRRMFTNSLRRLERGQFITTMAKITQDINRDVSLSQCLSQKQVKGKIWYLVRYHKLEYEKVDNKSLITVINYDKNQAQNAQQGTQQGTGLELAREHDGNTLYNTNKNNKKNNRKIKDFLFDFEKIFSEFKNRIFQNAKLENSEKEKILERLKKYSEDELLQAILNFSKNDWWMKNNNFRGISWFFQSDERVEQFINLTNNSENEDNRERITSFFNKFNENKRNDK